jgi:hypothetical protein
VASGGGAKTKDSWRAVNEVICGGTVRRSPAMISTNSDYPAGEHSRSAWHGCGWTSGTEPALDGSWRWGRCRRTGSVQLRHRVLDAGGSFIYAWDASGWVSVAEIYGHADALDSKFTATLRLGR